jgi:hypothetical protein
MTAQATLTDPGLRQAHLSRPINGSVLGFEFAGSVQVRCNWVSSTAGRASYVGDPRARGADHRRP